MLRQAAPLRFHGSVRPLKRRRPRDDSQPCQSRQLLHLRSDPATPGSLSMFRGLRFPQRYGHQPAVKIVLVGSLAERAVPIVRSGTVLLAPARQTTVSRGRKGTDPNQKTVVQCRRHSYGVDPQGPAVHTHVGLPLRSSVCRWLLSHPVPTRALAPLTVVCSCERQIHPYAPVLCFPPPRNNRLFTPR